MSIIPMDQIWVNANYKETQLKKMRIGQKVKFTSDLYGSSVVFHGKIVGLPGGAGNAFSLLPLKISPEIGLKLSKDYLFEWL